MFRSYPKISDEEPRRSTGGIGQGAPTKRNHSTYFSVARRGQSLLEFTILIIIVLAVFLTLNGYVKRGFQGRWKSVVDDLGDPYDPRQTNATTTYATMTASNTVITTEPTADGGFFTNRIDQSSSNETRSSDIRVGQGDTRVK